MIAINRKIKRVMLEQKSKYIGYIMLIFISSMFFTAMNNASINLKSNIKDYKEETNVEDAYFMLNNELTDKEALEKEFDVVIEEKGSSDFQYKEDSTLRILKKTEKIDQIEIVEGNDISKTGDILIDKGYAKEYSIDLNSKINIFDKEYTVTGYFISPDYIYPLNSESDILVSSKDFGIATLSKEDFDQIKQKNLYYVIKYNKDNEKEFVNKLKENNLILKYVSAEDNQRIAFIDGDMNTFSIVAKVVPIFILVFTCIFMAIVFSRFLKSEFVQIGTLYSLGYDKKSILKHYLLYPITVATIGGVLGTIAGLFMSSVLCEAMTTRYKLNVLDIKIQYVYVIISLILPFVFVLPTCTNIIKKALKLPAFSLLKGYDKTKVGKLEKKVKLDRFNFDAKFRIREIIRNVPRTLTLIIGIIFASMLVMFGFVANDSISNLISNGYEKIYQYEYNYTFTSIQNKEIDGEKVNVLNFTTKDADDKDINIIVYGIYENAKLINLNDENDNRLTFDKTIITKSLADKLDLEVGGKLSLYSDIVNSQKSNKDKYEVDVDNIANASIGYYVYMPIEKFNELFGYPKGSYIQLLTKEKMDILESDLLSCTTKNQLCNGLVTLLDMIRMVIGIITVISFLLGLLVIYVITSLVIEENRGSISLLKILGYSNKKICSLLLNTNIIMVVIGFIAAIPLIKLMCDNLFKSVTSSMNLNIPISVNILSYVISFVIVIVTYLVANHFSKKSIFSVSMVESLKNRSE
ncbi:ABC transporter permease [Clostridium sp. MSJ-8]|uniref:ABC transporter permease n=1 Tax=Clostridium sp. MSJ-8 TaxID=2841510 RepID=UPI001C0F061D|nr:ABC transporter permease [Clostridium sp. MSJ-8]MBU5487056.1 ABC transporter permease [Clostridium sp. MSJ-8]